MVRVDLYIDELAALLKSSRREVPALERLLSRASEPRATKTLLSAFADKAGQPLPDAAGAPYCALADGLPVRERGGVWARCDPVRLEAAMTRVYLTATDHSEAARWEMLEAELNRQFDDPAMRFYLTGAGRGYLWLAENHPSIPDALLPAPRSSLGMDIQDMVRALPAWWQALFNEIQMLLHGLGETAGGVNALWPWAAARLEKITAGKSVLCAGESCLLRGLAIASGQEWVSGWPARIDKPLIFHWSEETRDGADQQLERLETEIFQPLVALLSSGGRVGLHCADACSFEIRRRWRWPWKKSLAARRLLVAAE